MGNLFQELKRRKVFRVAAVYAVVAWLLIEVTSTILPTFGAPAWVNQTVTLLLILGFPIALILSWAYEITPEGVQLDPSGQTEQAATQATDRKLIYATFALVALIATIQLADRFWTQPASQLDNATALPSSAENPQVVKLNLDIGELTRMGTTGQTTTLDISSDGSQIIFSTFENPGSRLLNRKISELEPQVILQTNTGWLVNPAISPDNETVLFQTDNELNTVSINGGPVSSIVGSRSFLGQDWLSNDKIVFLNNAGLLEVFTISSNESEVLNITGSRMHRPHKLPGVEAILFSRDTSNVTVEKAIVLHNLETGETGDLIANGYHPNYVASGHIVFVRDNSLWAAPFDLLNLELSGRPAMVIPNIQTSNILSRGSYAVSENGRLIYEPLVSVSLARTADTIPTWIDRSGQEEALKLQQGAYRNLQLSPDDSQLALIQLEDANSGDIWVYDFETENLQRRTYTGGVGGVIWSLAGDQLIYAQRAEEGNRILKINADGSGSPELIVSSSNPIMPQALLEDGSQLLYEERLTFSNRSLYLAPVAGGGQGVPLSTTPFIALSASVSPDSNWLAYSNFTLGQLTSFFRPLPDAGAGRRQLSDKLFAPIWNPDGSSLFGHDDTGTKLLEAKIVSTNPIATREPVEVVNNIYTGDNNQANYAISKDGERFLVLKWDTQPDEDSMTGRVSLVVVDNWFEELKRLAPPDPQ